MDGALVMTRIRVSQNLLKRLERSSSGSLDRLANAISPVNSQTLNALGIERGTIVEYEQEVMRTDPLGRWRLNETSGSVAEDTNYTTDVVKHNGAYMGTVALGVGGAIASDSDPSVSFMGGYVTVSNHADFDFLRTDPFTFEAWVRPSGAANGAFVSTVNDSVTTHAGWEISYNFATSTITFHLAADESTGNRLAVSTTHNLHDGEYHYLVVTYAGTSAPAGVKFYVDNVLKTNNTIQSGLTGSTVSNENLQFAGRIGGPYTPTMMDEVAIYGTVLQPHIINWHWQAAQGELVVR